VTAAAVSFVYKAKAALNCASLSGNVTFYMTDSKGATAPIVVDNSKYTLSSNILTINKLSN
jgi:hypothetical protein